MTTAITPAEFDFLARRAGLTLTESQQSELIKIYPLMAAMAERLRTPDRGRAAEPAHIFSAGTPPAAL